MNIRLITNTQNPETVIAAAAKLCYSKKDGKELFDEMIDDEALLDRFLDRFMELGHGSPLEHATFTFEISGVSRSCSHQLVRHRNTSFNQKSQRYVDEENFEYVTPDVIASYEDADDLFDLAMADANDSYKVIKEALMDAGYPEKIAQENARAVLPNACATSLVMTMSLRQIYNFLDIRLCNRAQDEIREVATRIYDIMRSNFPKLMRRRFPICEMTGFCPEGAMGCGLH